MAAIKKAKIGDTIYDVVTVDEYNHNPAFYQSAPTAVIGGDGFLYPVRSNPNDMRPGFFDGVAMQFFNPPVGRDCIVYSDRNIIDFSAASSIRDVIEAQNRLASEERSILTNIDNEFIPPTSADDTPEMGLLKQAITDKHIDIDKYEHRFGPNYNNDKRLIKKNSITFGKLRNICNALDIKATLIMEDSGDDVPNPMGKKISVCLTDGFDDQSSSKGDE